MTHNKINLKLPITFYATTKGNPFLSLCYVALTNIRKSFPPLGVVLTLLHESQINKKRPATRTTKGC